METINNITAIAAAISTLIAVGMTIYKLVVNKKKKRINEYFDKIILPFVKECQNDPSKEDWALYVSGLYTIKDDFVPPYITFLINQNESQKLKHVIISDFYLYHDDEENNYFNAFEQLSSFMIFVLISVFIFLLSLCLFMGIFEFFTVLLYLLNCILKFMGNSGINILKDVVNIIVLILLVIFLWIMIKFMFQQVDGCYSVRLKQINKTIHRKEKSYLNKYGKEFEIYMGWEKNRNRNEFENLCNELINAQDSTSVKVIIETIKKRIEKEPDYLLQLKANVMDEKEIEIINKHESGFAMCVAVSAFCVQCLFNLSQNYIWRNAIGFIYLCVLLFEIIRILCLIYKSRHKRKYRSYVLVAIETIEAEKLE